jgi:hypothetical protein
MFFTEERLHFFKPLVGKYREQVVQCLCLLYQRQYSSSADYGQSLSRQQLVELLEEALVRSSSIVLETVSGDSRFEESGSDVVDDEARRFKNTREQAGWVLNQLVSSGWIERQVDSATLQSTFPFSRMGRIFAHSLIESDNTQVRTRHRNTRNTLNALEAFVNRGEVYDLLDAFDYSERIITDFTDVISELEERKRELVREVESQQLIQQATEQFFDFMEKRFQPDIQVRLSADSVEKHREDINKVIKKIRRKSKEDKADAERSLRKTVPDLCPAHQSFLFYILDHIEQRMRNAADTMLPALRRALHGFTKRADIIMRQLSYLSAQHNNDLVDACKELSDLSDAEYSLRLESAAEHMATLQIRLIDPASIQLQERKLKAQVDTSVAAAQNIDKVSQRELMIQQLLDQAFIVTNIQVREYVMSSLRKGKKISTRELQIDDAPSLLAMAHVIEVGAVNHLNSELSFKVEPLNRQVIDSEYYSKYDEFTIELVENESASSL